MLAALMGVITRELLREFAKVCEPHLVESIARAHGAFIREWFWDAWKFRDAAWKAARLAQ